MQGIENVSLFTAFIGGLLSFFSPCVLPLIPVYLSFISGMSFEQMTNKDKKGGMAGVLLNTLLFVLGFSCVFILLGAGASSIGKFLIAYQKQFSVIAGLVIALLALHFMGVFKINFLYYEKRVQLQERKFGPLSSFLLGFFFAFGWTPCIGPVLATILVLASQQESATAGIGLLAIYSAGLAIPFLLTAVFLSLFLGFFQKIQRYFDIIEVAIGGVLLLAATYLVYSQLTYLVDVLWPMLGVGALLLVLLITKKKLPHKAFAALTMVAVLVIGAGAVSAFLMPEEKSGPLYLAYDDFAGNPVNLSEFEGTPVLLNFFASWCAPCRKEIPELIKIHNEITDGKFVIVGVNCDENPDDGKALVEQMGIPYKVVHGSDALLPQIGQRQALPNNVMLDKAGNKAMGFAGFPGEEKVLELMDKLAAGEALE